MGWGSNDKGQLGAPAGLYKQVNKPMRIHGFDGQRLVCISAGAKHSAAVQEGGVVVTWGHGRYGTSNRLPVHHYADSDPALLIATILHYLRCRAMLCYASTCGRHP
jgi:alpha-tubulin suppressor-like RCC1 family protein